MNYTKLSNVTVAVVGDFCLDAYWHTDMTKSVLSRETPHFNMPVVQEKFSLGGAGNVVANLLALRVKKVHAIGIVGDDWRGNVLLQTMQSCGIDTSHFATEKGRFTNTYIKPLQFGYSPKAQEGARLDFENHTPPSYQTEQQILRSIEQIAPQADVICVCDQMAFGCITDAVRQLLCNLGKAGKKIVVDSRQKIALYSNVTVKPNDLEATTALAALGKNTSNEMQMAIALEQMMGKPAIVTCGEKGCAVSQNGTATLVPAFSQSGEVDVCGAGDTFLSAFAAFFALGQSVADAARYANAASCVTVHKVNTTGTATIEEIQQVLNQ